MSGLWCKVVREKVVLGWELWWVTMWGCSSPGHGPDCGEAVRVKGKLGGWDSSSGHAIRR